MMGMWVPHCPHAIRYDAPPEEAYFNESLSLTSKLMPIRFISNNCTAVMLLFLPVFYYPFHLSHSVFSSLRVRWPRLSVIASGFNICLVVVFMDRTKWVREGGYWMLWERKHLPHLPPIYQHTVPVTNAAHCTHAQRIQYVNISQNDAC